MLKNWKDVQVTFKNRWAISITEIQAEKETRHTVKPVKCEKGKNKHKNAYKSWSVLLTALSAIYM